MSDRRDPNLITEPAPAGPETGPLLLWLSVQLAALILAAARVPLAAKYPEPAETLAVHVMVVAQVMIPALLFPYFFNRLATGLAVIACVWPLLALAAVLSATPSEAWAAAGAFVTLWLAGLGLWRVALRGGRAQRYGVAVASLLAIGGAAGAYLRVEFNTAGESVGTGGGTFLHRTPVLAALRLLSPDAPAVTFIVPAAVVCGALILLVAQRLRSRDRLSTIDSLTGPAEVR